MDPFRTGTGEVSFDIIIEVMEMSCCTQLQFPSSCILTVQILQRECCTERIRQGYIASCKDAGTFTIKHFKRPIDHTVIIGEINTRIGDMHTFPCHVRVGKSCRFNAICRGVTQQISHFIELVAGKILEIAYGIITHLSVAQTKFQGIELHVFHEFFLVDSPPDHDTRETAPSVSRSKVG